MKYFWILLNSTLVAWSAWGGYKSMTPEALRHTNPDPAACLSILLIMPVFSLLTVGYSIKRWKVDRFSRPTWNRNPFDWWGDPLEALFFSTCSTAAAAIGSAIQRPAFGSVGFWTLGVYTSFAIGLSVGQILVYRVYRQRITSNYASLESNF